MKKYYKQDFNFLMVHNVLLWLETFHSGDAEYRKLLADLNSYVLKKLETEARGDIIDFYVLCEVEEFAALSDKTEEPND